MRCFGYYAERVSERVSGVVCDTLYFINLSPRGCHMESQPLDLALVTKARMKGWDLFESERMTEG